MKPYSSLNMAIGISLALLMSAATGSSAVAPKDSRKVSVQSETGTPIHIAHHVGNRPDWLDEPDNVHGGDYDPEFDPNGENNPPDSKNQPTEDPSQGTATQEPGQGETTQEPSQGETNQNRN